jgi:hypothetical protein
MTLRMLLLLTTGLLLAATLASQTPYRSLPQDTIVVRPGFLNNIYLLDGKRLNLQVMQWFMTDHPAPYSNIRAAAVADQLAVAGYAVGGLIFLSGYLIRQQDPSTGKNLMRTGGLGLGAGLILTIASNGFQHKAVLLYNEDIRQTTEKSGWRMGIGQQGLVLRARF